jgi:LIM domain
MNLLSRFFRIFAPKCAACGESITPVEGTPDTVRVVAMEKDFHVDCYVCEVSRQSLRLKVLLSNYDLHNRLRY